MIPFYYFSYSYSIKYNYQGDSSAKGDLSIYNQDSV